MLDSEDLDEAISEQTIRSRVQAILSMIGHTGPWELEWWSIYTANTLCLDEYQHGRVLFIGDAAHIVPIFGVRGLNNGLADAVNVAWKLAYVLEGTAGEDLLGSYTPERRGATLDVFHNAGKSSRFMTPPSRGYEIMRRSVLELSLTEDFARPFADPRQVLPYTYGDSPLTTQDSEGLAMDGGCPVGSAAVNRKISAGDFLLDHLGPGFTGLYFSSSEVLPHEILELFAKMAEIDPHFLPLVISARDISLEGIEQISDIEGDIFRGYDADDGTFYLIRPDRHIAARWRITETDLVLKALRTALGDRL